MPQLGHALQKTKFLLMKFIKSTEVEIFEMLSRFVDLYLSPDHLLLTRTLLIHERYGSELLRQNFQTIAINANYAQDGNFTLAGQTFSVLSSVYLNVQSKYKQIFIDGERVANAKFFLLGLSQLPFDFYSSLGPLNNVSNLDYNPLMELVSALSQSDFDFSSSKTKDMLLVKKK